MMMVRKTNLTDFQIFSKMQCPFKGIFWQGEKRFLRQNYFHLKLWRNDLSPSIYYYKQDNFWKNLATCKSELSHDLQFTDLGAAKAKNGKTPNETEIDYWGDELFYWYFINTSACYKRHKLTLSLPSPGSRRGNWISFVIENEAKPGYGMRRMM